MVYPVLKKLRSQRLSPGETASLLQKHIGSGSNEEHCAQALEAISRGRNPQVRGVLQGLNLLLTDDIQSCERVMALIGQLRSDAQD